MTRIGRDPVAGTSLAIRVIDASHHRVMPWKNGFGTTTEIAIDPPDADVGGRFRWRLSIAAVERSGPFSAFPGYERTILVIEGAGMELAVGGDPACRLDRPFEPFVFSGDTTAECTLINGPVRDFNLMVDRASLRSRLETMQVPVTPRSLKRMSAQRVVHCFHGEVGLALPAIQWAVSLRPNCTAIIGDDVAQASELQLAGSAHVPTTIALIELMPL